MKKKKIRSKLEKTSRKLEKTKSRLKSVMHELEAMQKTYGEMPALEAAGTQEITARKGLSDSLDSGDGDLQSYSATH